MPCERSKLSEVLSPCPASHMLVLSCSLLDSLTGRIAYAEPSDFGAIFPTQHYHPNEAHQI
jgi:hypothetical protein